MSETDSWWQGLFNASASDQWRGRDAALLRDGGHGGGALTLRESVALRASAKAGDVGGRRSKAWELRKAALRQHVEDQVRGVDEAGAIFCVTVAAIELVREPGLLMDALVAGALDFASDGGLRGALEADQVKTNLLRASGCREEDARKRPARLVWPSAVKSEPTKVAAAYFAGTEIADWLLRDVELRFGDRSLAEHIIIPARTGHGKSQIAESLAAKFSQRRNPPCLIFMDSQGKLLKRIAHLKCFAPGGRLADRIIYIDPAEQLRPPALNLFKIPERLNSYDARQREQVMNGIISSLDFFFTGLLGAELTQKQEVLVRYLIRVMLAMPEARGETGTLVTLRQLLNDASQFQDVIDRLDGSAGVFFKEDYFSNSWKQTKDQVKRRILGILENPTLERVMSVPERIDFFAAMQQGAWIFVDTAKAHLNPERSSLFGKLVLSLILQATYERAVLDESKMRQVLLLIDEAGEYLSDKSGGDTVDAFLTQARKYRVSVAALYQYQDQLSRGLRASIASNPGLHLVGKVSSKDAVELSASMGSTTPEFLLAQEKTDTGTSFALFAEGKMSRAVAYRFKFGELERQPQMSEAQFAKVMQRNNERYGGTVVVDDERSRPGGARRETPRRVDDDDEAPWA